MPAPTYARGSRNPLDNARRIDNHETDKWTCEHILKPWEVKLISR